MLELKNLSKTYGKVHAVKEVNLVISKGEFFCLLGPSGCGKTTILRMIAGFEKPSGGEITLDGKNITYDSPDKRDVNTVFQNYALFPNMRVYDNIAYGLKLKKLPKTEMDDRIEEVVKLVGLGNYIDRMPGNLSGGQQQRVALARALVNQPSVLLLDEPLSALDKKISEQTRNELLELQRKVGITFIFVTHNQTEALALADRIAVMKDGLIEQCDAPRSVYEFPQTHFVADFIGSMNFFESTITSSDSSATALNLTGLGAIKLSGKTAPNVGGSVLYCIRPERVQISLLGPAEYENGLSGIIRQKAYLGEFTKYVVELDNGQFVSVISQNYLLKLSNEFYDLDERVFIKWSQTSGEIVHANQK